MVSVEERRGMPGPPHVNANHIPDRHVFLVEKSYYLGEKDLSKVGL